MDKLNDLQETIVRALPEWTAGDDDQWATRGDVHNVADVNRQASLKTVGNNLAKLVTAGVVEKTLADDNRTALYRLSESYTALRRGDAQEYAADQDAQAADAAPADEPQPHQHVWIAGMVYVDDDDVEQVAAQRPVKCEDCDEPYRLTTDPGMRVEIEETADGRRVTHGDGSTVEIVTLPEGIKVEGARDADGTLYVAPLGTDVNSPGWVEVGRAREVLRDLDFPVPADPAPVPVIPTGDGFAPTGLDGDSPACDCPRQADKRLMHAADCAIVLWEAQRICPWDNGWRAPEAVVEICAEAVKPCPVHKPAETAAEPSEPQGVAEGTPAPVSAGSGALGDVLAFMQSVRPVSAPPAPEPRARRQRADGERPAWRVFAPGQLNAEVAAFLANLDAAQQQDGVTPTVVAKALNAQVGSVAFACMKLAERGAARQTSAKPKRYAAPA